MTADTARTCPAPLAWSEAICSAPLPWWKLSSARYCSEKCRDRDAKRSTTLRRRLEATPAPGLD